MTVERWGTVSDVITAIAAVVIAVIGGVWAWFRYKREDPDLPRVNSSVQLQRSVTDGVDYIAWAARIEHVSGSALTIQHDADRQPSVVVSAYTKPAATGPATKAAVAHEMVFPEDTEVAAGEYIVSEGVVAVVDPGQFVGYQATFSFCGEWANGPHDKVGPWTFECSHTLLRDAEESRGAHLQM